jgi:5-methylcytosine-specific restriction enzyme subunit McrC
MTGILKLFMNDTIRAFEHSYIAVVDEPYDLNGMRIGISEEEYKRLVRLHSKYSNYYSIHHRKIKLRHFVGVLQLGSLVIEILPKADSVSLDSVFWHNALCEMIRLVKNTRGSLVTDTNLRLENARLIDLYLHHFLLQVEMILHKGMTKKYLFKDGNVSSFKGKLNATKDVVNNVSDRSKAYCHYQEYSQDHIYNQVLKEALLVVSRVSPSVEIRMMAQKHLLSFEGINGLPHNHMLERLSVDRKHHHYEEGLKIAKLILATKSPDAKAGNEDSIAFLFDMNHLFEEFIFKVLKRGLYSHGYEVRRSTKEFWNGKILKPDILIEGNGRKVVIDTKWKNGTVMPSDPDIKQIFAYNERFGFDSGYLLYPGNYDEGIAVKNFQDKSHGLGTILISIVDNSGKFNTKLIVEEVLRRIA